MLSVHLSSYDARGKLEDSREKRFSSLASRVLSQLPKRIYNSLDTQLNHGPFLLEPIATGTLFSVYKRKYTKADKV